MLLWVIQHQQHSVVAYTMKKHLRTLLKQLNGTAFLRGEGFKISVVLNAGPRAELFSSLWNKRAFEVNRTGHSLHKNKTKTGQQEIGKKGLHGSKLTKLTRNPQKNTHVPQVVFHIYGHISYIFNGLPLLAVYGYVVFR